MTFILYDVAEKATSYTQFSQRLSNIQGTFGSTINALETRGDQNMKGKESEKGVGNCVLEEKQNSRIVLLF